MKYAVYKLEFISGVHFGTGVLNESGINFLSLIHIWIFPDGWIRM